MNVYKKLNILMLSVTTATAAYAASAIPKDPAIEKQVEKTLGRLTLEEKIGQMTEITLDVLGSWHDGVFKLDADKVQKVIGEYKVGSILNTPSGSVTLTPGEWYEIISAIQRKSMSTMGVPCIYGLDQNHGVTYTLGGVLFPQNINVAASFNAAKAREASAITAYETRAGDCPWTYSPTVDLLRDPRWPRMWESFGEDPLVNAVMGAAQVRGFQGTDPNRVGPRNVASCVKHYLGYGAARTGQDRTPAYISPSDLREKYFAPFEACIKAGALSLMVNSSSINGMPVHASYELLTKWIKEGLDWDGMIVTDWNDINNLYTRECVATDKKEAIEMAINAGIDMAMEPYDVTFCTLLKELVEEGKVPMSRIDDAVRRVLRLKYRLGLFKTADTKPADYKDFGSATSHALALEMARQSEVLLKNDGILPLKKGVKILVSGPNANSMRCLNGGWSYSWQGHIADKYAGEYKTIYEALKDKFGDGVKLEQGVTYRQEGAYHEENAPEIERAVAAAGDVDVIVACVGENSYCETPGNLDDLALSGNQQALVKALAATGKPVVLVLNEGRPRLINEIVPLASAVIDILLPGNMGAVALADILAGDANPSARLPFTYPSKQAKLVTYDYKVSEQSETMEGAYDYSALIDVQWPFGYGLSYTTFGYSELRVNKTEFTPEDVLEVSVDVTNTGKTSGGEVVMLYSRDVVASLVPDNRRLRAFERIELAPGESRTVTLRVPARELAFVGADGKFRIEKGEFTLRIADRSATVKCDRTKIYDND